MSPILIDMTNDDVRITFLLDRPTADLLDQDAALNDRSRSSQLRLLLRRALAERTQTLTSSSTGAHTATTITERQPCADGQHVRAEAKSGSGMIGCKNCGMVKVGPNWVKSS